MSNQKFIRLKDKGSIFHDMSQDPNVTLTGTQIVKAELTTRVGDGLRVGTLVEASEEEVIAYEKAEAANRHILTQEEYDTNPEHFAALGFKVGDTIAVVVVEKAKEVPAPAAPKAPETPVTGKHIVTQEDLDNNADLVAEGVKVGDEIEWEAADASELPAEKGGDTKNKANTPPAPAPKKGEAPKK